MALLPVKTLRAAATWTLIVTLLGMGSLDVVICRGADGHFGVKTHASACCSPEENLLASCCGAGAPQHAEGCAGLSPGATRCQDAPVAEWTLRPQQPSAGDISVPPPAVVSSIAPDRPAPEMTDLAGARSVLRHLRTTTLLI